VHSFSDYPELMDIFTENDLIWAKTGNKPFWPGIVVQPPVNTSPTKKRSNFYIRFYGNSNSCWCRKEHVKQYEIHKEEFIRNNKELEGFQKAIDEIEEEYLLRVETDRIKDDSRKRRTSRRQSSFKSPVILKPKEVPEKKRRRLSENHPDSPERRRENLKTREELSNITDGSHYLLTAILESASPKKVKRAITFDDRDTKGTEPIKLDTVAIRYLGTGESSEIRDQLMKIKDVKYHTNSAVETENFMKKCATNDIIFFEADTSTLLKLSSQKYENFIDCRDFNPSDPEIKFNYLSAKTFSDTLILSGCKEIYLRSNSIFRELFDQTFYLNEDVSSAKVMSVALRQFRLNYTAMLSESLNFASSLASIHSKHTFSDTDKDTFLSILNSDKFIKNATESIDSGSKTFIELKNITNVADSIPIPTPITCQTMQLVKRLMQLGLGSNVIFDALQKSIQ